jgi:hypothetical protein
MDDAPTLLRRVHSLADQITDAVNVLDHASALDLNMQLIYTARDLQGAIYQIKDAPNNNPMHPYLDLQNTAQGIADIEAGKMPAIEGGISVSF